MTTPSTTRAVPTRTCQFCGRTLRARMVDVFGDGRPMFCGFEQCHCAGAEADRAERERREAEAIESERRARCEAAYARAGVPKRYLAAESPRADELVDGMLKGHGAYLWGSVGTGKTTCLAAMTRRLVDMGKTPRMVSTRQLIGELEQSIRNGGDPIGTYGQTKLLLLDDLGKEQPTGYVLSKLFTLVDDRYDRCLPTAITTQYRPSELVARLSERGDHDTAQAIVSRLRQGTQLVEFSGRDLRL